MVKCKIHTDCIEGSPKHSMELINDAVREIGDKMFVWATEFRQNLDDAYKGKNKVDS